MRRKILLGIVVLLVLIQLIRPERNEHPGAQAGSIAVDHPVPAKVQGILERACYDCHSNNTRYPWYSNIQPFGWWLQHHVDEGRRELNFDEFRTYSQRKHVRKLEETIELVKKGEMPLESYTWIHKDARLSDDESRELCAWADGVAKAAGAAKVDTQ